MTPTNLEELSMEAEQLANMALVLEDAMFNGPNSADVYGAAMNLFTNLMLAHSKAIEKLFNETNAVRKLEVVA